MVEWVPYGSYEEILFHKACFPTGGGIAKITINRPNVRNAFTPLTVEEMIHSLRDATEDQRIGVVILTGAGDLAFCSGGDQKIRGHSGYRDETGTDRLNVLEFHLQLASRRLGITSLF